MYVYGDYEVMICTGIGSDLDCMVVGNILAVGTFAPAFPSVAFDACALPSPLFYLLFFLPTLLLTLFKSLFCLPLVGHEAFHVLFYSLF